MTQTKFFRWTLLLCLSGATSPLAAQGVGEKAKKVEQMQVLKTDGKVLRITVDGKEQQIPWVINPSLRPDVFETSGEEVVFRSKIDTIRFNVAKEGCYDFVVVTHQGDSAMTRIKWVSANPLEEPSRDMLKRSAGGLLSDTQFPEYSLAFEEAMTPSPLTWSEEPPLCVVQKTGLCQALQKTILKILEKAMLPLPHPCGKHRVLHCRIPKGHSGGPLPMPHRPRQNVLLRNRPRAEEVLRSDPPRSAGQAVSVPICPE